MILVLLDVALLIAVVYIVGALMSWWTFFGFPASMRR